MNTQKKYDKAVVTTLSTKIETELKKPKSKREMVWLSLKENNIIKAINPAFSYDRLGEWNGYGYVRLGKHLQIENFSAVKRALKKMSVEEKKEKAPITDEQRAEKWAARLSKLTGITLEEAKKIAEEKIDYKMVCIWRMQERQADTYSTKREKLIAKMERENPLRRITDEYHAQAILAASNRHNNTDYEARLEEARELADMGQIDRSEVKSWARQNAQS